MKWVLVVLMMECCALGNMRVYVHDNEADCREEEAIERATPGVAKAYCKPWHSSASPESEAGLSHRKNVKRSPIGLSQFPRQ
jgi:hypothetical protein